MVTVLTAVGNGSSSSPSYSKSSGFGAGDGAIIIIIIFKKKNHYYYYYLKKNTGCSSINAKLFNKYHTSELYTHESRILNSHDLGVSLQPAPRSHCRLQIVIVNIGLSNAERVCTF